MKNGGGRPGGVMVALLDSAMAEAALSRIHVACEVATIDLHVAFLSPASGPFTAAARPTGGGRSVCFCEAELADAGGRIVAKAMGTYRYRPPGSVQSDTER
jgi:uncharacterized protein (TIGR00369 family)